MPSEFQSSCIETDLVKLHTFGASSVSDSIRTGFTRLSELYNSIEELIHSPLTLKALRFQQHTELLLEEALEGSVGLLDACTAARELMFTLKEKVQDLQSALRRRGADSVTESSIRAYITFRKNMKKEILKILRESKRLEGKCNAKLAFLPLDNYHFLMVIKTLRETSEITKTCLQSLLMFFSAPVNKTKYGSSFLLSKLMTVGADKEQKCLSEMGIVDVAVCDLYRQTRKGGAKVDVQMELSRLETLDDKIKGFELGLDCLFRCLIRHRVSLLNIMTP